MMAYQPVIVKWADAHSGEQTWHELTDEEPYIIDSCGFLVPEGEGGKPNHVTIVQNITPDEDVDHVLYIPAGMVQSISYLVSYIPPKMQ